MKTYDQIFDNNKINLLSDHHEAHFITAFRMFEDNKLMGIGPRGFRSFVMMINTNLFIKVKLNSIIMILQKQLMEIIYKTL